MMGGVTDEGAREQGRQHGEDQGPAPALITEVPAYLRGQSAPPPPLRREDPPAAVTEHPTDRSPALPADGPAERSTASPAEPEERTRVRAGGVDHRSSPLRQPTGATVPAVWCPAGHFSPPDAPACRVCGRALPPQQPIRIPRPTLGTLHLPEGGRVLLDRSVVLGRRPLPLPDGEPWPHLVELPGDLTHLSRNHVAVELDGWHVLARDLGSSGGTALLTPGRAPIRLRPHDPHVLEPGQALVLSGDFTVTYTVATS